MDKSRDEKVIALLRQLYGTGYCDGLVLKPEIELKTRSGHRIITKVKHKDF